MNSFRIDTLVVTPNNTKPTEGGMIGAMIPDAAIRPHERLKSYPASRIMGTSITASVAVSAIADPDRLASTMPVPMTTYPRPPRIWPTRLIAAATIFFESPPAFISSPARRK